jgi:hypothetical protein
MQTCQLFEKLDGAPSSAAPAALAHRLKPEREAHCGSRKGGSKVRFELPAKIVKMPHRTARAVFRGTAGSDASACKSAASWSRSTSSSPPCLSCQPRCMHSSKLCRTAQKSATRLVQAPMHSRARARRRARQKAEETGEQRLHDRNCSAHAAPLRSGAQRRAAAVRRRQHL